VTALKVLGIIALVLFLLSMIRLGAVVEFSGSGLTVRIKAGALQFTVFPRKSGRQKREKKSAKPQKEKKEPEKGEASVKGGALALVKEFLPLAADAAGRVKRTIRIDRFYLDLTMAAGDPAPLWPGNEKKMPRACGLDVSNLTLSPDGVVAAAHRRGFSASGSGGLAPGGGYAERGTDGEFGRTLRNQGCEDFMGPSGGRTGRGLRPQHTERGGLNYGKEASHR